MKQENIYTMIFAKDMPIYDYHCHLDLSKLATMWHVTILQTYGSVVIITNGVQCVHKALKNSILLAIFAPLDKFKNGQKH